MGRLIRKFYVGWFTLVAIVAVLLIVSTAATNLYTTYTTNKQIQGVTQYCKDVNGYLTFSTTNNYSGTLKTTVSMFDLVPKSSTTSRASCSPTGTSKLKLPNGGTLLPNSIIVDEFLEPDKKE